MNELKPNISIVIPVYNVEKYLVRCLDSIFIQEFSGTYEVIAVEDASTDDSLRMLKSYQVNEPRLKIIEHGVNKKLSMARATGMKASTGDFIMHVDSDDWLLPGALENLYKRCLETDADVLVFNYASENSEGKRTLVDCINKELITTDKVQVQSHFLKTTWNKIVKKSLTENLISGEVAVNSTEDLLYATEILLKARTICLVPETHYVYFVNTESLTWVVKPEQLLERQIIILQQIKKITLKYEATSQFTDFILNYLEKGIYFVAAQSAFLFIGDKIQNNELINAFKLFTEMTDNRLNKLSSSMDNKYYSLVLVFLNFGTRPVLGIILRSIKNLFNR